MELLAIVRVEREDRVYCQIKKCNRLLRNIYVVQEGGELTVVGSECFKKTYPGHDGKATYTNGATGKPLSEIDRELFRENTAKFIEQMKLAHAKRLAEAKRKQERLVMEALKEEEHRRQVSEKQDELEKRSIERIKLEGERAGSLKRREAAKKRARYESLPFDEKPVPKGMTAFECSSCGGKYHWMDFGFSNACRECGSKKVRVYKTK